MSEAIAPPAVRTRAEKVILFIERFVKVPEGSEVGKPLILSDFQKDFIYAVYDNPYNTRRGILSIGRKNGKTALIACLVLAHLCGPVAIQNGQIVSGALSRDQAALVYNYAEKIVLASKELSVVVKVTPSSKRLVSLNTGSVYQALAAESSSAMGLSPSLIILDEIGQVKGPSHAFVDALTTSQGAHANPLQLVISTQAPTDGDLLSMWIDDAAVSKDPRIVCHLHAAPADCDLMDRDAWLMANPGLGTIRSEADLRAQIEQALRLPSMENMVRNLLLNQRVQRVAPFLSKAVWDQNSGPINESYFTDGRFVYVGLDLSSKQDLTSMVITCLGDDGLIHQKVYAWTPADTLLDRTHLDRVPYDVWSREGWLEALPGKSLPYSALAVRIAEILEPMTVKVLAYDRWRMDILKEEFNRIGVALPLAPFGQGFKDMSPALDEFEECVLNGRIRHGDNPVYTMCISNTAIEKDSAGNRRPTKSKSHGRIDAAVASLMSLYAMRKTLESEKIAEVSSLIG
jgi:phage terminase large subunit-like protein